MPRKEGASGEASAPGSNPTPGVEPSLRYQLDEKSIYGSFGPALTRRDSISNVWSVPTSSVLEEKTATNSNLWLLYAIQRRIGSVWWEIDRVSA
jgi:hypothetical protein